MKAIASLRVVFSYLRTATALNYDEANYKVSSRLERYFQIWKINKLFIFQI
jgi:hypothetical protein